ncbi:transcription elongation factor TFIIS-like [Malania oleifera]|uniref:transcription elongation factor TFIIS-like n=1 Tax=Malania oleifera TaxID=397392 RepID=UPI0025AE1A77|nr:transcription elongation factor TFIIS-like [Malania oleifera]XP_057971065.1 transcription elongation factor TFIIS-like [Malania oleifera]XP_057971066.1 transcription elongation factor TFIIS-like [Malania oleifera]XP_057971067.1 transcription elongation factor TFIIS-like [Malania oleifera]XP_057971068.1 transcription elongation factor TFIIS-like [Malania oleifera]XP_057971069.1 transcription elongation factor TFIIS-like [Malania oleifera]XP_057971071.1 transcription elongation factor TFIIS-
MDRELVELFESAKKAADTAAADGVPSSGPEVSRCVDVLKQLTNFPVSYDVLVSTQIGKRLRHLTKHPREKIQVVASDLLDKWKKIVIDETTRNKKNGSIENKCSTKMEVAKAETARVEKVQKSGAVKIEKVEKSETVKVKKIDRSNLVKPGSISTTETIKVEKNNGGAFKVERISREEKPTSSMKKPLQAPNGPPKLTSMIKCNDALRDKIRELLLEALSRVACETDEHMKDEVDACDPIRVAVSVESVMFEKMGRSNGSQKVKYRSIMFNLKDSNNPDLRRKVLLGQVKPERLITMAPEEMASDQRQRENKQIKEKALFDCERGGAPKASTDQFKCGRCGQRKCTYYQLQTRSADEPMTTFVTCVNCNNHWKFC